MSGLVMEKVHACDRTDTAADYGKYKKSGFRNPPGMFLSLAFIYAHQNKADEVYNNKVNYK